MILSNSQVVKLLKKPSNSENIVEGRKYESRLRLYTETKFEKDLSKETSWSEYKKFLMDILSKAKYDKIMKFIQFPLPVVDITESILSDIYKVFEARNRYFSTEIKSSTDKANIQPLLIELAYEKWIENHGKQVIKNKPNSIVVLDKDEEGKTYPILVESDRIRDYHIDYDSEFKGQLKYVSFLHSEEMVGDKKITYIAFYDAETYRVFETEDNVDFTLVTEQPHTAGYCPAIFFVKHHLNETNEYNRKIPFSNSITKLQEWQVFDTYKFYADHYAPFPIIEAPKEKCSVPNCNDGVIVWEEEYVADGQVKNRKKHTECPRCKSRDLIGPGTVVRIEPKMDKDDPSESGVFKVMDSPVDSLEYVEDKLQSIEANIKLKTVGIDSVIDDQAINEDQVQSTYESRINVLLKLKENFDHLYKWMTITTAKLFNPSVEIHVHANFGTEFYLLTEDDLHKKFETAKKIGLPETEVDMIYKQLIDTKYKGNPSKINRSMIVKYLDPMPFANKLEAKASLDAQLLSEEDYQFKLQLVNLIDRFEMEQAPLVAFGENLDPWAKIQKIKEILKSYINESSGNGEGE